LGAAPFSVLINDQDDGAEYTLSEFADDTKLGGVADKTEGRADSQSDCGSLEKWLKRNLKRFNKEKCKVLPTGRNDPCTDVCWGPPCWKTGLKKRPWWCWWPPR